MLNAGFWRDRRVVVTGHTGFKGAWLNLWLHMLGARVSALSLPPDTSPNIYSLLGVELEREVFADLRERQPIADLMAEAQPEIVLHLAAQSLVRRSYAEPCDTFATNVLGTANLLDAARRTPSLRVVLVVTTDKVYENLEAGLPFVETDRLGGHDPYSASKACTELVVTSFRRSFFVPDAGPRVATARAGNVVGGGDWAVDRVVPDLVRAAQAGEPVRLRYPAAQRPWQHVLEPLAGYLMMVQALDAAAEGPFEALNFAPDPASVKTVAELVDAFTAAFDGKPGWVQEPGRHPHEAQLLTLSAQRAQAALGWRPLLGFEDTVRWTADWYRRFLAGQDMRQVTADQIHAYMSRLEASAANQGLGRKGELCGP